MHLQVLALCRACLASWWPAWRLFSCPMPIKVCFTCWIKFNQSHSVSVQENLNLNPPKTLQDILLTSKPTLSWYPQYRVSILKVLKSCVPLRKGDFHLSVKIQNKPKEMKRINKHLTLHLYFYQYNQLSSQNKLEQIKEVTQEKFNSVYDYRSRMMLSWKKKYS